MFGLFKKDKNSDLENLIFAADKSDNPIERERLNQALTDRRISNEEYIGIRTRLYARLAQRGDAFAQLQMGALAELGNQPFAAEHWYILSANGGNVEAIYSLGLLYSKDANDDPQKPGVGYNPVKSFQHFLMAAERGYVNAISHVAMAYLMGEGVQEDREKEYYWLLKGAELNSARCCLDLSWTYTDINSPHYDLDKGVQVLKKVLILGDRFTYELAVEALGHVYGDAYIRNEPETKYSDRKKAAYCFTMAYIMFADVNDFYLKVAEKTGYHVSRAEFDMLKEDVVFMRSRFIV